MLWSLILWPLALCLRGSPEGVSPSGRRPTSTAEGMLHMDSSEMPIFTRTYDLLAWLLPASNHFPRAHRHTLTQRLLDAAFN